METSHQTIPPAPQATGFYGRHEFLLRRLHSLSGIVPVGAYMCIHLLTNATVLGGPQTFQEKVDTIHSLGPALPFVEWTFIFIPIIFHAALGIVRAVNCEPNSGTYRYGSNVRYTLQRVTAWIALLFIGWHVFHMHGWFHNSFWTEKVAHNLGGGQFDPEHATSTAAAALQSLLVKILYTVGVLSTVYHLANGLWTSGITWGLWTTPAAQRRADYVCGAFGLLVAFIGMSALFGMSRADIGEAQAIEQARIEQREEMAKRVEQIKAQEASEKTGGETAQLPADAAKE
ncbi:MAG TPA: succinate dehydrogenase cytochrome b558 subunit [Pirellulales bacterium]|nr:succinate dehydrogenase cytochrome b558 subunit [Pirellulales bacterium]HVA51651.1 succinate dehydrogenase cytochrome b558 subunit [Pirellulales bacterium]